MEVGELCWDDIKLFVAVATEGSVSAAARRLRLGQATVSRRLGELEQQIGQTLFERGRTGTRLTTAGEQLLGPARQMAEWATAAEQAAAAKDPTLRGLVRITAAPLACTTLLASFAGLVCQRHPGIQLEVSASLRLLDLRQGDADLAVRSSPPERADLVTVGRTTHSHHVYVSRQLARRVPASPKLADLPWVAWAPPFDELVPNPQLRRLIPGFSPAFTSDDFLVLVAAAEAGVGAIVLPESIWRFLPGSQLVPLAIDLGMFAQGELFLIATKAALGIPRVRVIADELWSYIQEISGLSRSELTQAKT